MRGNGKGHLGEYTYDERDATPWITCVDESTMFSDWSVETDADLNRTRHAKESELLAEMDTPAEGQTAYATQSRETTTIGDGSDDEAYYAPEDPADVADAADTSGPPNEASVANVHWLEEVASRYSVHLRTLDRWLKATGIVPHRDSIDLRRRYLTDDEVNTLDKRYGRRRASRGASHQEDQERQMLARIASLQEEVELMKQRMARVDALDRELDQLEQTMREMRSRVGHTLKEVTKLVTAARLDDSNAKNEQGQREPAKDQQVSQDPDNFQHNRKRS